MCVCKRISFNFDIVTNSNYLPRVLNSKDNLKSMAILYAYFVALHFVMMQNAIIWSLNYTFWNSKFCNLLYFDWMKFLIRLNCLLMLKYGQGDVSCCFMI